MNASHAVAGSDEPTRSRQWFATASLLLAAFILLVFTPSYWAPLIGGSLELPTLIHVHAFLFFGWVVLLAAQARLAAADRYATHRRLGIFTALWALAAVVLGVMVATRTIARDLALIDGTPNGILTIIGPSQVVMFTVLVGLGLLNVRRPAYHQRFMLLATLMLAAPSFARLDTALLGADSPLLVPVTIVLSTALLIGFVWVDSKRNGRIHPVFLWGTIGIVLVRIVRIPLAMSPLWRSAAEVIAGWPL